MENSDNWLPNSWRKFPIKQQPNYQDRKGLKKIEEKLAKCPPLIDCGEAESLKKELAQVCHGKAFLLQGGDCAESFAEFSQDNLKSFFRTILQMTVALMYGCGKPVVKIGRIAGQFAKPRSSATEIKDDKELPSYRGDIINRTEFDEKSRRADPELLLKAYFHSAATLNYLRSLSAGGYASIANVSYWNEEFMGNLKHQKKDFIDIINRVNSSIKFIESCGLHPGELNQLNVAKFYSSHEGLLLNYEEAFTRQDKKTGQYYCLSAHMLWIGDRTRSIDEAHIEFMRGISNPIAFKIGPTMEVDNLIRLIDALNPNDQAGRLTLICRMGCEKINKFLPPLVKAVKKEGRQVVWSCDPMHGNTIKSSTGYKTRRFENILAEINSFFKILISENVNPGGIHFEMTGQDVTECLGGLQEISELNLKDRYHTHCDPRLNASQSLELAFLIAEKLKNIIN